MTTISGYIARETEKAVAFVATTKTEKPLWIPRSKILAMVERDDLSANVQLAGERIRRVATPVDLEIDAEWMAKIQ